MGWGGLLAGTFILSFYSVIAGWAMAYFFRTAAGTFDGLTADGVGSIFTGLIGDPERLLAWHTLFMVMTTVVVARGVRGGLEQAVRFLMPALFVLLLVMVGYAMSAEYADELGQAPGDSPFMAGLNFLFVADFSKISGNGVLVALGHAFFTLSLGMGAIMVYGSYLPKNVSIARTSITIAVMDTLVALLAGMAIFPIVFANGLEPGAGPGLIFNTLPIAFGRMPGGVFFGSLFFLLLTFAAWTSAISLIEPVVAWLVENRGHSRTYAATLSGGVVWLLGVGSVFSFNIWSGEEYQLFGKTFFDILDYLTANIMLPLGGLLIALFAGWRVRRATCVDEVALGTAPAFNLWYFVIRYISPVAVVLIFLKAIGVL
jgi:NSS family neurotransmitter:Na+ symporter